jgi:hypothetical protein
VRAAPCEEERERGRRGRAAAAGRSLFLGEAPLPVRHRRRRHRRRRRRRRQLRLRLRRRGRLHSYWRNQLRRISSPPSKASLPPYCLSHIISASPHHRDGFLRRHHGFFRHLHDGAGSDRVHRQRRRLRHLRRRDESGGVLFFEGVLPELRRERYGGRRLGESFH